MDRSGAVTILFLVGMVIIAGCSSGPATGPDESTPQPKGEAPSTDGTLKVHNINVGQSSSTLVVGPTGETMLIDTGDYNDDGEYVLKYLKRHNIDRIDHLVVSHNDADHIGGTAAVIEYYETEADGIGAIYDPGIAASTNTYEEYLDAVEEHDVTLYQTREGDSISFEGVDVDVLGPPDPYLESEARNENSIVLRLQYGDVSFLWTGDAEDDQEAYLVEEYGNELDSTIYKAGHHGSSSSSGGALLDAAQPEAVIISSAYDSRYDHPNEEVLQRLADRSIPTYWTATHGTTVLVTDGGGVSIRTQQDATTDSLSLRDEDSVAPGTTTAVEERTQIGAAPSNAATLTPTPTVATDGGTDTGQGELVIETINADAEGDDRENLNDEYVVFRNDGDSSLELTGWTVSDEAGKTYQFPDGFIIEPGATVTLHTGSGTDTETDLYWDAGRPVWNNGGDTVIVTTAEGDVVIEETYS
jgi:competence protein ComEC